MDDGNVTTDEVFLEGLRFYGYDGVNPEERAFGQRFVVDVHLAADLGRPGRSDDLGDTVNYSAVAKRVRAIVEGPPRELIETVGEEITTALLAEHALADSVTVTLRKPEAVLKGIIMEAAGVRVRRVRSGVDKWVTPRTTHPPTNRRVASNRGAGSTCPGSRRRSARSYWRSARTRTGRG